jgi:hypothetical protein
MEELNLKAGDIVVDSDEGLTGVIQSVELQHHAGLLLGSIRVHWMGLGTFSTSPAQALEALRAGDWTVQKNLIESIGLVIPKKSC